MDSMRLASAFQGDAQAQCNLGHCRLHGGEGVGQKDPKDAARLFRLAAHQGLAAAQNNLGYCYFKGEGVSKISKRQ